MSADRLATYLAQAGGAAVALATEVTHLRQRQKAYWQQALAGEPLPADVAARVADLRDGRAPVLVLGASDRLRAFTAASLHYGPGAAAGRAAAEVEEEGPLIGLRASEFGVDRMNLFIEAAAGGSLYIDDFPSLEIEARDRVTLAAGGSAGAGVPAPDVRLILGAASLALVEDPDGVWRRAAHVVLPTGADAHRASLKAQVEAFERGLLRAALRAHGGNKTRTADTLGITREGLHKKLAKYRIEI